jgi:hypothetical protein
MTLLVLYHASRFKNFKTFYNGVVLVMLRPFFPDAPCSERFLTLTKRVWVLLAFFLAGRSGDKTGIDSIDSTPLPVCHNRRIANHKVFEGLAERGKTSMGWFFGFKLHLVFNHMREIVAVKLTPGNVSDTAVVPQLTKDLMGKLFGDKGYIGKKLAEELLRRGLVLMTRVRANMKSLPVSFFDKALLNGRSIAETIIGHIKEFSSLRLAAGEDGDEGEAPRAGPPSDGAGGRSPASRHRKRQPSASVGTSHRRCATAGNRRAAPATGRPRANARPALRQSGAAGCAAASAADPPS